MTNDIIRTCMSFGCILIINLLRSVGNWHIVQIDAWGTGNIVTGNAFHVQTLRKNPAQIGAVTGSATLLTFFASLQRMYTLMHMDVCENCTFSNPKYRH